MQNKKSHDYLLFSGVFTNALTEGVKEIIMISISNINIRNNRTYGKFCHETNGGKEYLSPIHSKNINGQMKINNDTVEKVNPFLIADLLPSFIERQIFNEKKPKAIHKINITRSPDKQASHNRTSDVCSAKDSSIRRTKERIESKKNIPLKNNHNHTNFVIAFGFSSILCSTYKKYHFSGINIFGGFYTVFIPPKRIFMSTGEKVQFYRYSWVQFPSPALLTLISFP